MGLRSSLINIFNRCCDPRKITKIKLTDISRLETKSKFGSLRLFPPSLSLLLACWLKDISGYNYTCIILDGSEKISMILYTIGFFILSLNLLSFKNILTAVPFACVVFFQVTYFYMRAFRWKSVLLFSFLLKISHSISLHSVAEEYWPMLCVDILSTVVCIWVDILSECVRLFECGSDENNVLFVLSSCSHFSNINFTIKQRSYLYVLCSLFLVKVNFWIWFRYFLCVFIVKTDKLNTTL